MSPPPFRNLGKRIIICCTFLPLIALSQVTIKEKIQISPKEPVLLMRASGNVDFFSPPLFLNNEGMLVLPIASTVTASGSVSVQGELGYNHRADVSIVSYGARAIAWEGRYDGVYQSGSSPFTTTIPWGEKSPAIADIRLRLFDDHSWLGDWRDGSQVITITDERISYVFEGALYDLFNNTSEQVHATATLTGNFEPYALFTGWNCNNQPLTITGQDST